mmetsp:Transcript_25765/g.102873  ORF Transcript_25765/g.102873 Transcript_25765/m.102873 type:complete len:287 (+) Transcript_25765:831-1691(+)
MSEAVKKLTIREIECRGLRSAELLSKNDVYVVFKVGSKKVKTKYISGGGRDVKFKDVLELTVSDADLEEGIDVTAYDYDLGPDPDDLLGVGKLTHLTELKEHADQKRQFETQLMYKGKHRGDCTCIVMLAFPEGGGPEQPAEPVPAPVPTPVPTPVPVVAQVAPVVPEQQFMTVTCPANAVGGMQVVVQAPDGTRMQVVIPQGVQPGGQFRVPLPAPKPVVVTAAPVVQPVQYVQQPPVYAAAPAYGQPPPQYGAPPPQMGAPPPQYGAPPPQYGQPPQYGAPPPY